jgi:DNA-binding transcriptional regulator GbsR (MarR family)
MNLVEAKEQFINSWGALATQWGINRTMAQVHALLLVAAVPMSTDDIMHVLKISRGNANMNLRELIDWKLVEKQVIAGERREFFVAEKDMWKVLTRIMYQRKKRELDPMLEVLQNLSASAPSSTNDPEWEAFSSTINRIQSLAEQADQTFQTIIKAEENWFWSHFVRLVRAK